MALAQKILSLEFSWFKVFQEKDMVQGLPEIHTEVNPCESCIIGKQHRKSYQKGCLGEQVYFWN